MKNLFQCRNLHFRKQFISLNCTELILATPLPGCYQQPCTNQPQSGSSPPDVRELLYNSLASEWDLVCCAKLQRQTKSSIAQTKQRDKDNGQILAANYAYEHSLGASNINRACRKKELWRCCSISIIHPAIQKYQMNELIFLRTVFIFIRIRKMSLYIHFKAV